MILVHYGNNRFKLNQGNPLYITELWLHCFIPYYSYKLQLIVKVAFILAQIFCSFSQL